jgi:hypothetical protein
MLNSHGLDHANDNIIMIKTLATVNSLLRKITGLDKRRDETALDLR